MKKFLIHFILLTLGQIQAKNLILEAEKGIVPSDCSYAENKDLSNGKGVVLKNAVRLNKNNTNSAKPYITLNFKITSPGKYDVTFFVLAASSSCDSFYVAMDNSKPQFAGVKAGKSVTCVKKTYRLKAAPHTLKIFTRENNIVIDKVEIGKATENKVDSNAVISKWAPPPYYPPAGHPRVLLNPQYLKKIKQRIKQYTLFSRAFDNIKAIASENKSAQLGKDKYLNHIALTTIQAQAFLYIYGKNLSAGENAINNIKTILAEARYKPVKDVTRTYGRVIFTAGIVYDWCFPLLKATDKDAVIAGILKLAAKMEIGWPPVRQSSVVGHAGESQLFKDLLAAGIAVYDKYPYIYDVCARRLFSEMVPARNFMYKSGAHSQGSGYGSYRFAWEVWSALLIHRMNGKMLYSADMAKVPYSMIYARLPNGNIMPQGDNGLNSRMYLYSGVRDKHLLFGALFKDPYIVHDSYMQGVQAASRLNPLQYLLFANPEQSAKDFSSLPLTRFFPEPLGAMITRTGWKFGIDSDSAVIRMTGAGHYFANHQHLDAGSFQIYYKGFLAIDSGIYNKYGTKAHQTYTKRSIAHNCMLFYDKNYKIPRKLKRRGYDGGQHYPGGEPRDLDALKQRYLNGHIPGHSFGPNKQRPYYSYMKVDLKAGYGKNVLFYTRTFCFLNFDNSSRPGALIVLDRTETAKPDIRKIWLLHSIQEPVFNNNQITVVCDQATDSGKLVDTVLLPEKDNIILEKLGPPKHLNHVFGNNFPDTTKKSMFSNKWRTQLSPKQNAGKNIFLNVLQIMDAKEKNPLPVKLVNNADLIGAEIDQRIVFFSKSGKNIDKEFNFIVPGNKYQILLTDLAPGEWTIQSDKGKSIKINVSSESGTAFSLLERGKYTASRKELKTAKSQDLNDFCPKQISQQFPRVVINNRIIPVTSIEHEKGEISIPANKLLQACGAKVTTTKDGLKATGSGQTLQAFTGKRYVLLNGEEYYFKKRVAGKSGQIYLPLEVYKNFLRMNTLYLGYADMVLFSKYPESRFDYPWYVSIYTNRNDSANPVENASDGNLDSHWAGGGKNAVLRLKLDREYETEGVRIAWLHGDKRKYNFQLELSRDGKNWTKVFDGKSSGTTRGFEPYKFPRQKTRYVKLTGNGNTSSSFTSIYEIAVIPAK